MNENAKSPRMTTQKIQQIDFLLFCTQSPDYFLPTTACLIQDKLGLPTTCGALDFNLGCSGFVYALNIAKGFSSVSSTQLSIKRSFPVLPPWAGGCRPRTATQSCAPLSPFCRSGANWFARASLKPHSVE